MSDNEIPTEVVSKELYVDLVPGALGIDAAPNEGELVVQIDTENSQRLRDAAGVMGDLRTVDRLAELYKQHIEATIPATGEWTSSDERKPQLDIEEALWRTAIVTYCRCFNEGARYSAKLPLELLDAAGGDARLWHHFFVNLRDKYIAHSVNSLEQTQVFARLTNQPGVDRAVIDVQTSQMYSNPVDGHSVDGLRWLVSIFYAEASTRFEQLSAIVRSEVAAMDLADVYDLPRLRFEFPDIYALKDIRPTRKKHRRSESR